MTNIIEFRNFANDNKEVFADFYYNDKYILSVSEHIECLYQHEFDDEAWRSFRDTALTYLTKLSVKPWADGIFVTDKD